MARGVATDELRTQPEEELVTRLKEAKEELFNLRFQAATGQLDNHQRLRVVKSEIARIYTVMRERELGIYELVEVPVSEVEEETTAEAGDSAEDTDD
jgi:large subunit ribosomal protein L29